MVIQHSSKTLRAPRAIIFDTDNTLYAYDQPHMKASAATEAKAVRLLGADAASVRAAFSQARDEVKKQLGHTASSHSRLLYFQRGIEILGRKTQLLITLDLEQTYWRTFLSQCSLFPGVRELLINLRNNDISTAIITDLTSQIQFRKIIYFGLDDCFDYVVTSEEAGADKPDPAPFKLAIEKLGVDPDQIWMVGDSLQCDIEGAREFGMSTLFRVDRKHSAGPGAQNADIVFDDFRELDQFIFSGKIDGLGRR